MNYVPLIVFWALSRATMYWLWSARCQYIINDVLYYHYSLSGPDAQTLTEYPTPILWLLRAFDFLASGNNLVFQGLLIGFVALLDAGGVLLLARLVSLRAGWYWCAYLALVGPLIWFRLDLIPAFFVMLTLVCATTGRDVGAGVALALAAASKFWPAILIGALLGVGKRFNKRLLGFAITGGVIGGVSLLFNGWDRSLSPLTWQSERGLQIESVLATRPMYLHAVPDQGYKVIYSQFNAFEVVGPDVEMWLRGADVAFVVAILVSIWLSAALFARRWQARAWLNSPVAQTADSVPNNDDTDATGTTSRVSWHYSDFAESCVMLAIIALLIVGNKTYSPQYMMWLAGPAAMLVGKASDIFEWVTAAILGASCLVAALLTTLVYPFHYLGLIFSDQGTMEDAVRLVARNLLMLLIALTAAVLAGWSAWRVGNAAREDD
jgi:hypothetical protein